MKRDDVTRAARPLPFGQFVRQRISKMQEEAWRTGTRDLGSLIQEALGSLPGAADGFEVGFLARALVQATLPHRDPGSHEYVRRNGRFSLSIFAPTEVGGLPFGRYPRLVLAFLCTEAVCRKSRHVALGPTLSAFCSKLGIAPTSGPRGSLTHVRQQMRRLFASTFHCLYHDAANGRHAGEGFLIVEKRELWWDPTPKKQLLRKTGGYVVLSERFFREATEAPVPLDLGVLRSLRSPLEIDIYVWLTFRFHRLKREILIPWSSLMLQFGCAYASPRHFRHRFVGYLRSVIRYYPAARVAPTPDGLVLRPSATHVRPRRSGPASPTTLR